MAPSGRGALHLIQFKLSLPFRERSARINGQTSPYRGCVGDSVLAAPVLVTPGRFFFLLNEDTKLIKLMGGDVLTVDPFDANAAGQDGNGAEIGII